MVSILAPVQLLLFPLDKRCSKCGETKPTARFVRQARQPDGLHSWCKDCFSGAYHPPRTRKRLNMTPFIGAKVCPHCETLLVLQRFGADARRPDERFPWCLRCRQRDADLHAERDAMRVRGFRWCTGCAQWHNPDMFGSNKAIPDGLNTRCREAARGLFRLRVQRLQQSGGSHTAAEWRALKEQYAYSCVYCGVKDPTVKLTKDHVVPVSKGGTDDIGNIAPACIDCNRRKASGTFPKKHTRILI